MSTRSLSKTEGVRHDRPVWFRIWRLGVFCVALLAGLAGYAQESGTVAGMVVNTWNGLPLPAVTITVRGTTLAVSTDANGRYELKSVLPGIHVLRFSKSGYTPVVVNDVRVLPGQTTTLNGNLQPEIVTYEEFEVTAAEFTETTGEILENRNISANFSEGMGSDLFDKLGASDAGDIISKIPGASIVDGRFAIIRGLSDRYTAATLNGSEIPSADPYRKAVQLDLFPAGMIERVEVSKTFTPNQPGSFTGGNINIITRSFPDKPFVEASFGVGYNTQATGNENFLIDPDGTTAPFRFGRDVQQLPGALRPRDVLQAGGSFGETTTTPRRIAPNNETLNGAITRREQANQLQDFNRMLGPTPFEPATEAPPPNHEFSFEAGSTFDNFFGRRLGVFAAFNYGRSYSSFEDGVNDRYTVDLTPRRFTSEDRSRITTEYGGMANVALEISLQHSVGYTFLINNNVEEDARVLTGFDLFQASEPLLLMRLGYTERAVSAHQFSGKHDFPDLAHNHLDWQVSYVHTSQDEPDYRFFNASVTPDGAYSLAGANLPQPNYPTRFFRELEENNLAVKLDDTQPFDLWRDLTGELKFGAYASSAERTSLERAFSYQGDSGTGWDVYRGDINDFLTSQNLNYTATRRTGGAVSPFATNYTFRRFVSNRFGNNDGEGTLDIYAGYLMVDTPVLDWLRIIGGARAETTLYEVTGISRETSVPESRTIDELDILPAASLVITPITNMNVRLSYAQTIARPSFRELTPGSTYDPITDDLFVGNPDLELSHIDNYDLRWEWFRRPGEIVSLSFFYKYIDQPIERRIDNFFADQSTFVNREKAELYGVEFEARTRLDFIADMFDVFTLGANVAYIESEVPLDAIELSNKQEQDPGVDDTRPLYDQSPYVINLDLSYDNPRTRTSVTLAANLTGERLFLANPAGPDIYEHPPTILDLIISQRLGQRWKLKFTAKNLLNAEYKRTYGEEPDSPLNISYTRGQTFSLSLSAQF